MSGPPRKRVRDWTSCQVVLWCFVFPAALLLAMFAASLIKLAAYWRVAFG